MSQLFRFDSSSTSLSVNDYLREHTKEGDGGKEEKVLGCVTNVKEGIEKLNTVGYPVMIKASEGGEASVSGRPSAPRTSPTSSGTCRWRCQDPPSSP